MPIFDYHCDSCGHTFDVLQKLGADALVDCPECGEPQLKKMLSAPAFHLKGKGWRNSDDAPKKPDVRPKFAHTLDSPVPHAEHTHDKSHGHSHSHEPVEAKGGIEKLAREAVKGKPKDAGHSHGHSHGPSHGPSHSHGHGHKHKHD
jgi:putative FmdB family regulatory protein